MWYPAVICITFKELLLSAKVQFLIGDGKYLTIFFTSDFLFRQIRQTYSSGELVTYPLLLFTLYKSQPSSKKDSPRASD